jgi:hypothetical protein
LEKLYLKEIISLDDAVIDALISALRIKQAQIIASHV